MSEGDDLPRVTYTPRLLEYMAQKGRPHVVVDTCCAKTCGGPIAELNISVVDDARLEELLPEARGVFRTEVGSVLIMARGLEVAEDITFGIRSFLGAKDVTAEGIRAFRF